MITTAGLRPDIMRYEQSIILKDIKYFELSSLPAGVDVMSNWFSISIDMNSYPKNYRDYDGKILHTTYTYIKSIKSSDPVKFSELKRQLNEKGFYYLANDRKYNGKHMITKLIYRDKLPKKKKEKDYSMPSSF